MIAPFTDFGLQAQTVSTPSGEKWTVEIRPEKVGPYVPWRRPTWWIVRRPLAGHGPWVVLIHPGGQKAGGLYAPAVYDEVFATKRDAAARAFTLAQGMVAQGTWKSPPPD